MEFTVVCEIYNSNVKFIAVGRIHNSMWNSQQYVKFTAAAVFGIQFVKFTAVFGIHCNMLTKIYEIHGNFVELPTTCEIHHTK